MCNDFGNTGRSRQTPSMEASRLRLGLDTALRRGCQALARTDRVAVTVHRCCTALLAGTEDVTAKVFGTVPRTTDGVSVTIQLDPATGGGADDLSRSIRLAGRIGLGTNHLSFPVGRAGPVIGLCRYAAQEQQEKRDRLSKGAASDHGHFFKASSLAVGSSWRHGWRQRRRNWILTPNSPVGHSPGG